MISSSSRQSPLPVLLEVLPRLGHRPHAHPVHPVPLHMLIEQLALLGFGQPAAEVLGHLDHQHEKRRMRPVERLRVQRVVAAAGGVDSLDGVVVLLDLLAGLRRAVAVIDDAHDRIHRARNPLQRFTQQDRVLLDAGAQFRIHVLDGADPHAHHSGAQVTEILPRQRVGSQRSVRNRFLIALLDRAGAEQTSSTPASLASWSSPPSWS